LNHERAAVSRRVGAGQVVDPRGNAGEGLKFEVSPDVSIEVTGNAAALQVGLP
jgi:hypothetical protein